MTSQRPISDRLEESGVTDKRRWRTYKGRAAEAESILDLQEIAKRRVPKHLYDFVEGGAGEGEITLRRNRAAFQGVEFFPDTLRPGDLSDVDTSTNIFGRTWPVPIFPSAIGSIGAVCEEGEAAAARAAHEHGLSFTLSTAGTISAEGLRAAVPEADLNFQLYMLRDPKANLATLERAKAAGYNILFWTMDSPVGGRRLRDRRNRLRIPLKPRRDLIGDMAKHPDWWYRNALRTVKFPAVAGWDGELHELMTKFDPARLNRLTLEWLLEYWDGPVVVKGIQNKETAVRAIRAGAHGIVISNHGGRQIDRGASTLAMLTEIVPAVKAINPNALVFFEGGGLSGADAVAAYTLGADACGFGRAWLYGEMAAGLPGVRRSFDLLTTEFRNQVQQLGARDLAELRRGGFVRFTSGASRDASIGRSLQVAPSEMSR